jgi:Cof subfamily protein (haloacid dehalogenase superfamily)
VKRNSIRLLAVDIDGTLTDPNYQISARNIAALRSAHEAGVQIVLATGRRHDYAMPVAREIGVPMLLISSNGALVRSSAGETFYTDRLPARTATELIQYMGDFRSHAVLTFDREGKGALVLERFEDLNRSISRWLELNAPFIEYISPLENSLTEDPIQAMYCGKLTRMEELERHLNQAGFLSQISVLKTQYDHRDLCILDILNRNCSKGHALRRWAENQGISREQIMAIGDNYNDLEMLEFAGLPFVMGNASQDMKQSGWKVTGSNAEHGVAQALEEVLGLAFKE